VRKIKDPPFERKECIKVMFPKILSNYIDDPPPLFERDADKNVPLVDPKMYSI